VRERLANRRPSLLFDFESMEMRFTASVTRSGFADRRAVIDSRHGFQCVDARKDQSSTSEKGDHQ
jgi:hypothetical protein